MVTPESFDRGVSRWIGYAQSNGGKLRNEAAFHHLGSHLPEQPGLILDVGGGTGEFSALLARSGYEVTLLDFSSEMLAEARRQCVGLSLRTVCADLECIDSLWKPEAFGVVLAHSVLEFVPDPAMAIRSLARVLRVGGVLSVMAGNRYHATLRKALLEQDFVAARLGLDQEVPDRDLFGLPRRTFYPHELRKMVEEPGLKVVGEYGVRIFVDLLDTAADTGDLLPLELAAASRMPFRHTARFVQLIATK